MIKRNITKVTRTVLTIMAEETLVETMEEISVVTFSFGRIVEQREERRNRGLVGGYEKLHA